VGGRRGVGRHRSTGSPPEPGDADSVPRPSSSHRALLSRMLDPLPTARPRQTRARIWEPWTSRLSPDLRHWPHHPPSVVARRICGRKGPPSRAARRDGWQSPCDEPRITCPQTRGSSAGHQHLVRSFQQVDAVSMLSDRCLRVACMVFASGPAHRVSRCRHRAASTEGLDQIHQHGGVEMPGLVRMSLDSPEETRPFEGGTGHLQLVNVTEGVLGRATFLPGWRWSEHVKPIAKTARLPIGATSFPAGWRSSWTTGRRWSTGRGFRHHGTRPRCVGHR
jgi:hypothetical protein